MGARPFFTLAVVLAALATPDWGRGDEPAEPSADQSPGIKNSFWQPVFRSMAEDYRIAPTDDGERNFKLLPSPIFRWAQPVRGGDDGALFVWLDGGRLMAVGSIFAWPEADGLRVVQHEFHSFAATPIEAAWRGNKVWSPAKGVERTPVPEAPVPAGGASQRLRQLKTIAGGFTGNSVDSDDGRWELRLLSNPLYRYSLAKTDAAPDGALFALAQGTDPEVLLLIEAVQTDAGYEWRYCCGRFSDYRLQVRYLGKEVWNVGPSSGGTSHDVYHCHIVERRPRPEAPPTQP